MALIGVHITADHRVRLYLTMSIELRSEVSLAWAQGWGGY